MKTMNRFALVVLLLEASLAIGCGSGTTSSGAGGTETGTTTTDTTNLADHIKSVASSLVPNINGSTGSASVSSTKSVTYGSGDNWSLYIDPSSNNVLTDIFGSADIEPKVVTKIRVLLDQFSNTVSNLLAHDPALTCAHATALNEGDTISLAFYGDVSNGTSTDRHFSCISTETNSTTIYGRDASGVVRIVTMGDQTSTNTESPEVRGDQVRIRSVVYSTYVEQTESGVTASYLDLNFAHITSYNGVDSTFGSADDVLFKSRSRVSGRATLDASGNATLGVGDFNVTKYDKTGSGDAMITRTLGRGSYGSNDYVLFNVNSNASAVASVPGTYCIQIPTDATGLPISAANSNCTALEDAFAWGTATFPFGLLPALDADFSAKAFYEDDGSGMIANDGSNFSIPTYH